ncbi:EAL domain-containing protein [Glaciecola sp. KUL10]|uniref:EAL domain-containing protein n=1 Tax=Glaciecola sp. (strain KUL10) TaxID=2161813 RepID=UPI001313EA95|nr:EAL domain-containing protein [Glaciecola sp. KUL10]
MMFSFSSFSEDYLQELESIEHFRAFPIITDNEQSVPFIRQTIQDRSGFLWLSGEGGISLFDGYKLKRYPLPYAGDGSQVNNPSFIVDQSGKLWAGQSGINYYDDTLDKFVLIENTKEWIVYGMIEDKNGFLWFGGLGSGLTMFDLATEEIVQHFDFKNGDTRPKDVISMVYEKSEHVIWFTSYQGLYRFSIDSKTLEKVTTPLDGYFNSFILRNMSIDEQNRSLWLGTQKGLLRVNTSTFETHLYGNSYQSSGLATQDVTTTFIDSNNRLWVGLEKAGLCLYKPAGDKFICLSASFNEKNRLPFATIEDIFEDKDGSLWLAMNQYGLIRVSPKLEKMRRFRDLANEPIDNYFPHSFDGIERPNGEIWFATDGGGINILNPKSGEFRNLKSVRNKANSLSSNSVITIAQDEHNNIWAGTWSGGLSKINPETMEIETFQKDIKLPSNQSLAGNNIFSVESDHNNGIWLSIWGMGLQHFDLKTKTFRNYIHKDAGGNSNINNIEIYDLQIINDKLYVVGQHGLEVLDINSGEFTTLFDEKYGGLTYVHVESEKSIWLGSFRGVINLNSITGDYQIYDVTNGLSANEVGYLAPYNGQLWVATSNGLSIIDLDTQIISRYYQRDGLTGNEQSTHGEFLISENRLFMPGKYGITVIENGQLPTNDVVSKARISQVDIFSKNTLGESTKRLTEFVNDAGKYQLPYTSNSLRFAFTSPNYIFPEHNRFRYRLKGWQNDYVEVDANERFANYTNLPAGEYTFEVFAANSSGVWSSEPNRLVFTVLPPWWSTWWFSALVIILLALTTYSITRVRLSVNIRRERYLSQKVNEKTKQLAQYTAELERASESLSALNQELEDRVLQRTQELQCEVNERKQAEEKLLHMAFHDSLTDLPNRQWITQHIETLINRTKTERSFNYAVMFLDGDRFKQINDTLGHLFGDKLLISCARRLLNQIPNKGHAGRLGGDEFTVVLEDCTKDEAEALAETIVKAFERPFKINEATVYFNVSVGLVLCDLAYDKVPTVLKNADIAMYHAKEAGKSTFKTFDLSMQAQTLKTSEIEQDLRETVEKRGFQLAYQPIFDLKTNILTGFEALIRWYHPKKGFISPLDFIPIAEETGLIWEIGEWVLAESCRQAMRWHQSTSELAPTISINLSSNQLRNTHFLDLLDDIMDDVGIDSKYVKLELTESLLIENSHQLSQLYSKLKQRQIDLALDDFGTGYSSLAYLNEIPVQYLKIDRSFVAAIDNNTNEITNPSALKILKAIVSLGKGLGKQVTAEGIETEIQLTYLKEFECDLAQGFYLAKPLSEKDANQLVLQHDSFCISRTNKN